MTEQQKLAIEVARQFVPGYAEWAGVTALIIALWPEDATQMIAEVERDEETA